MAPLQAHRARPPPSRESVRHVAHAASGGTAHGVTSAGFRASGVAPQRIRHGSARLTSQARHSISSRAARAQAELPEILDDFIEELHERTRRSFGELITGRVRPPRAPRPITINGTRPRLSMPWPLSATKTGSASMRSGPTDSCGQTLRLRAIAHTAADRTRSHAQKGPRAQDGAGSRLGLPESRLAAREGLVRSLQRQILDRLGEPCMAMAHARATARAGTLRMCGRGEPLWHRAELVQSPAARARAAALQGTGAAVWPWRRSDASPTRGPGATERPHQLREASCRCTLSAQRPSHDHTRACVRGCVHLHALAGRMRHRRPPRRHGRRWLRALRARAGVRGAQRAPGSAPRGIALVPLRGSLQDQPGMVPRAAAALLRGGARAPADVPPRAPSAFLQGISGAAELAALLPGR
jgi:hypothetical protein